ASGVRGPVEQAASVATITSPTSHWSPFLMGLILLEALAAGLVFILIIWWTMFSGRNKGELHDDDQPEASRDAPNGNPPPET
ncbi:hypothetical protein, partial [Variovorax sp. Varisp62]|uniref:hypothetical protein n=1 Tax=Variovorax sp. Varisp62 TaxID=3243049 RepID=UPI0039B3ABC3